MADVKVIYKDSNGYDAEVSTSDSLVAGSYKTTNYELTDTRLGTLVGGSSDASSLHNHDGQYFRETEFINTSAGVADAGKPIKTDAAGKLAQSFIDIPTLNAALDHGVLAGLGDDDHTIYTKADGTRAFTGNQSMGGNKITSLANGVNANDAINKSQLDAAIAGFSWKQPVETINLIGNGSVSTLNGLTPLTGDAYIVTSSGTLTAGSLAVATGDMVEFNGTVWTKLITNSGGFVPAGIRAVLGGLEQTALVAPYTAVTDNDKVVVFDGLSNTGAFTSDAVDSAALFVQDATHSGVYDNTQWVYEGSVPTGEWVQTNGLANITAGDGLSKVGNTLNVNVGNGIQISGDAVTAKIGNGLKFSGDTIVAEPADIAGEGLVDDGSDNLAIDWSTAYNDSKAVKASDLASTASGKGASIIGIQDAGNYLAATNVEAALQELAASVNDIGITYTAGGTIAKGDLVYISSDDTVVKYTSISGTQRVIGLAAAAASLGNPVKVLANDTILTAILPGSPVAGATVYWNGTALVYTKPSATGHIWKVGEVKNAAGDLHVEVEFIQKNA